MKTRLVITSLICMVLLGFISVTPAYAANTAITGGTNGASCNSGGYFTPSSVTVTSGDTVTFSVPSSDPYSGGLEIHGFPQGNFTVATGGSVTTSPITANVSYYGTWPSTGCMKGSGTITVSAPAPPPPPANGGSSSSGSSSPAATTTSSTSTKKSTAKSPATTITPSTTLIQPTTTTEGSVAKKTTKSSTKVSTPKPMTAKKPAYKMLAIIGGSAALLFAVAFFVISRFIIHRKPQGISQPAIQAPAQQPPSDNTTTTSTENGEDNETHQ